MAIEIEVYQRLFDTFLTFGIFIFFNSLITCLVYIFIFIELRKSRNLMNVETNKRKKIRQLKTGIFIIVFTNVFS